MPNLAPPVTSVAAAEAYRDADPRRWPGRGFTPLMTCYLIDQADPDEIVRGFEEGVWAAAKLYPAHATTNSALGRHRHRATSIRRWRRCSGSACRCCVHGEVTDPEVDMFDREAVFIERVLAGWSRDFPGAEDRLRAYHHRRGGRVRRGAGPNARRDDHAAASRHQPQRAVRRRPAARMPIACRWRSASGTGWRSARAADVGLAQILPRHRQRAACASTPRRAACGCAGIFNAPFALETYAAVFEEEGALDRFEAFAELTGRLLRPAAERGTVTLERAPVEVPDEIGGLVPFRAGETSGVADRRLARHSSFRRRCR